MAGSLAIEYENAARDVVACKRVHTAENLIALINSKGMQLWSNDYVLNGRKDAVSKGNSKHGYR
jgi:hypothetical protein